jgi:RimJ/RimL family protein N-acetyltransferase
VSHAVSAPTSPASWKVVHVVADDAARLRALRLRALAEDPEAFGATVARDAARPGEWWRAWAADSEAGSEQRTFILADGCAWLGLALVRAGDDGLGELLSMWLAPRARGSGAMAQLVDACAGWARERGLRAVRLAVFAGNPRARAAYERCGFTEVDRADIVTDDGRELVELRMELAL